MIEQSELEQNFPNILRIEDLKIEGRQLESQEFTTVYEVDFGRLYLFTGMSY
jgi:hypothetical protein